MSKRGRPVGSFKHIHPTRVNGLTTKAYSAWQAMVARCSNPKAHNFEWYGARGIAVCDRWLGSNGYDNFVTDIGVPLPGFSLGRIDNSKGYGPDNCRWETSKEQASNRRPRQPDPNTLKGRALAAGLPYHVVYQRIRVHGWPEALALSTPKAARVRREASK